MGAAHRRPAASSSRVPRSSSDSSSLPWLWMARHTSASCAVGDADAFVEDLKLTLTHLVEDDHDCVKLLAVEQLGAILADDGDARVGLAEPPLVVVGRARRF